MGQRKKIYSARDPIDAKIMADMLSGAGIHAEIRGSTLWGARGELPLGEDSAPSLWVREEDVAEAREILRELQAPQKNLRPWRCSRCSEEINGRFHQCWKCGTMRNSK